MHHIAKTRLVPPKVWMTRRSDVRCYKKNFHYFKNIFGYLDHHYQEALQMQDSPPIIVAIKRYSGSEYFKRSKYKRILTFHFFIII